MTLSQRSLLGFAFAGGDMLIEIQESGTVVEALGASVALLGIAEHRLAGRNLLDLVDPGDRPLLEALLACLDDGQRRGPVTVWRAGSRSQGLSLSFRRLPDHGGRISCVATAGKPAPSEAGPDGLQDRNSFERLARSLTEAARISGRELELAMVELAGLDAARGRLSPDAADRLDQRVAGALRAEAGDGGAAARLDGERYAVMRDRPEAADGLARRLTRAVTPVTGGHRIMASAQAVPLESAEPSRLARAMRFALDDFISDGLRDAPPASLAEAMNRSVRRTLNRAGELGSAVSQRRFSLAFQPVVTLDTGALSHHEALVRFEEGASPFAMVRLAEEFDLIEDLDRAVIEQAVRKLKADRTGELRLAVNVSGRSISASPFVENLCRLISSHQDLPRNLIFEITESAAIDDLARANRHIQSLRALGSLVCLDDFGAGAASLAYLQQLTIDIVKIDGRYVRDLAIGGRDAAVVRHLVKLCKDLNVRTVAEIVETSEVEEAVRIAGVDMAQGWLYGRPAERPLPPEVQTSGLLNLRRAGVNSEWR